MRETEILLTPRQIGLAVRTSTNQANRALRDLGYQWRDDHGDWRLADAGVPYGREFRGGRDNHMYYVRWRGAVVAEVQKALARQTAVEVLAGDPR